MKILFLTPYPNSGPSTRFRIKQYLSFLDERDISYRISPFISEKFYRIIYRKGNILKKILYLLESIGRRFFDAITFFYYDAIFIHLESFPVGPPFLEMLFRLFKKPVIFDLDDAIYLQTRAFPNRLIKILKFPQKIGFIIKSSNKIITCNEFLKDYAMQFGNEKDITVIHTPIDTDKFFPKTTANKELVIGWIGTHTTSIYLLRLEGVFRHLSEKYDFVLKIIGAGRNIIFSGVNVENQEWVLGQDIENFQNLDIGIYPLVNDEWIKGKTGFKTIQYMSVGVPCVVSAVGSNLEIVRDGVNGFLAASDEEWLEKLTRLIEDKDLRLEIGRQGRVTVEANYSLKICAPNFLRIIEEAVKK